MDDILKAIILGIVEGVTEFLPISSTGHMVLVGKVISFTGDKAKTFEVFIQLGAILSVLLLYKNKFLSLLDFRSSSSESDTQLEDKNQEKKFRGVYGIQLMAIGCLPIFVLGFLFHKYIKSHLLTDSKVAIALIVGGILMIVVEKIAQKPKVNVLDELTIKDSIFIGLFQCMALFPGMSRSGSTLIGGLLSGVSRKTAAEYSFLIAVPVMIVATLFDLKESIHFLTASDIPLFATGFIVSFIVAIFAVKLFISFVIRFSLISFGIYRILLGSLVLYLIR